VTGVPSVIDNQQHRLGDVLNELLAKSNEKPFDVATAYFSISGYRVVQEHLKHVGAFRLLIGSDPKSGADVKLKADERKALKARLQGDLEAEPFTPETLTLVEELIALLRAEKVQIRLYDKGFLHAKAYLFHQDPIHGGNYADRFRPFAAIVGSSNFTGPGLLSNRELNLVHRVITADEAAVDEEAAQRVGYLGMDSRVNPSGADVPDSARRLIKSEVGARAITDLTAWYERQWGEAVDFEEELIELLDASKFGAKEYTPYQVYIKALYEYFREQLGEDAAELGRSAVDLAEFQEDSVRKARRILSRYHGVLIADSVGLGKTFIGKKLLEDFAYHRRQKAVVVCSASLRSMWRQELASATIAAQVVGMEEMGREEFDPTPYGDADVILVDESHNFRNDKANRYLALDQLIQRNGGRGRDGERKKVVLLSATPINNDVYDLASQVRLFTQNEADHFREAAIGDLDAYFRHARRTVRDEDAAAGEVLFNLLEEIMVRNTRPYIRAAYPNATINGELVTFPDRKLRTINYDVGAAGGLYDEIAEAIEHLSLAPYRLEAYRKKSAIRDEREHEWTKGREIGFVGIFKTRFLKRLESSITAFRESLRRALVFEETYEYLLDGTVVASGDFQKALRFLARDEEDELAAGSLADEIDANAEARQHIESLPHVNLNHYDLRKLTRDVKQDVQILRDLYDRTEPLAQRDGKLERIKKLLAGELKGQKVLIFSSFKDTSRYVHRQLTDPSCQAWREAAGRPTIRRIDSGNHPEERGHILKQFAPVANKAKIDARDQIDILISTDVLSEGQNLQDCGYLVNYDLTWNPVRLVQRNGRIDRIGSPHAKVVIHNMFPEEGLEKLLGLVERLSQRIATIDRLGLLDASVLGEVVHPRTFNVLRRIRAEDGTVLDEEEARAELAGPELLLKQLRQLINREGVEEVAALPNGIHSGLRRTKCQGMFFYFQAPRPDGTGKRHFWRYIDARSHEITENRYEIARMIECHPDEPRVLGDQDVFLLQEKVIKHILSSERQVEGKAVAATAVHPIQQVVAEELKDAIRRGSVDRELAKRAIAFLGQAMGRSLLQKLRKAHQRWSECRDDAQLLTGIAAMAEEFGKERPRNGTVLQLGRQDLDLICFEYVCGA
jgi:SNF2 family DNA or RNA helicase